MIIDKEISIPPIEKKCNGCQTDNFKGLVFYEFSLGIALCQEWSECNACIRTLINTIMSRMK